MTVGKITKTSVDSLSKGPRDTFLWDTECKGFGVKVTPEGRRIYVLQYRMGGRSTPTRRYKIGQHGSGWTPELARREANRLLILVAQGIDPAEEKRRRHYVASELTFNAVADRFEEKGLEGLREKTREFFKSTLRIYLRPKLGKRPLPAIQGSEIFSVLDGLSTHSPALRRNVFAVARRMMRWAKGRGIIDRNPLEGFEVPAAAPSRDRVLSDHELKLVWTASEELGAIFCGLVRLLLLTGQRRDEVAGLEWQELDRARAEWILPSARAKNGKEHLIPLSQQVIAELDVLAGSASWPRKGFVLTTDGGKSRVSGFSRCKRKLDEQVRDLVEDDAAPVTPWRFHDLRRSVATGLQRLRVSSEWIEAVQNRRKAGVAGTYQRYEYADEKREALQTWGRHVAAIVHGAREPRPVELADAS